MLEVVFFFFIGYFVDSLIVEVTGNENKVQAFLELIAPFGVVEQARTGTVSLRRGKLDE